MINFDLKAKGTPDLSPKPAFRLTRFDKAVLLTIGGLLLAVLIVVLIGDRVGVYPVEIVPQGEAASTTRISIRFSEDMAWDTSSQPLRIEPPVEGVYGFSRGALTFTPASPLIPNTVYRVTIPVGLPSANGRQTTADNTFTFTVRQPRVAFAAPATGRVRNVWIADPTAPESAKQVTFSTSGIYDFAVSPDGQQIAYAELNVRGTHDLWLLDVVTGATRKILDCPDADCTSPVWRPDGAVIAYHRVERNSGLGTGIGPTRVWLLELNADPPTTYSLFSDSQIIGYNPQWSADGERIAFMDSGSANPGIFIYDFSPESEDARVLFIPSTYGGVGAFSPDGLRYVFPELLRRGEQFYTYLKIADLSIPSVDDLTNVNDPVEDAYAAWHPDGRRITIGRKYLDNRATPGLQIFLLTPETGEMQPLVVDPRYANSPFSWDASGTLLVIQRFQRLLDDGQPNTSGLPEIWTYNLLTGELVQVYVDGMQPQWMP